jgi:hypothetical protein
MLVWSIAENEAPVTWWRWDLFLSAARRARRAAASLIAATAER